MKASRLVPLLSILLVGGLSIASTETPTATAETAPAAAQSTRLISENVPANLGRVEAFIVRGTIQLIDSNGIATVLKRGAFFTEGNTIKTGADSQVLLVFSNGATLKVLENCEVTISLFRQQPFDTEAEGSYLRLSRDPSRSNVILDVSNGKLFGAVKELNKDAGSTFVVNGPAEINGV